jgi:hypothetical protein
MRQGFAHDAAWRREALLLNSSEILANVLGERLAEIYTRAFSSCEPRYAGRRRNWFLSASG